MLHKTENQKDRDMNLAPLAKNTIAYSEHDYSEHFEFSGDKSKDLICCVLYAIHLWKKKYNISLPDDILFDQAMTLLNELKKINK